MPGYFIPAFLLHSNNGNRIRMIDLLNSSGLNGAGHVALL
jgi:hypothetical protein